MEAQPLPLGSWACPAPLQAARAQILLAPPDPATEEAEAHKGKAVHAGWARTWLTEQPLSPTLPSACPRVYWWLVLSASEQGLREGSGLQILCLGPFPSSQPAQDTIQ